MNIWTKPSSMFGHAQSRQIDGIGPSQLGTSAKAQLLIFTPTNKQETIIRPVNYYFKPEFMREVCDHIYYQRQNVSGCKSYRDHISRGDNNYQYDEDVALPSETYHICDRRVVNDLYRFVLIVDNAPTGRHDFFRNSSRNRTVYTGWCSEEPVSARGIINYDCEFIFTHINQTNLVQKADSQGMSTSMNVVNAQDIISNRFADLDNEVLGDRSFLTTPDFVLSHVEDTIEDNQFHQYERDYNNIQHGSESNYDQYTDEYRPIHNNEPEYLGVQHNSAHFDDVVSGPYAGSIDQLNHAVYSKTLYNSPRQSLNRIVSCMARIMNEPDTIPDDDTYVGMGDPSFIATKMRNILSDYPSYGVVGPDINKTIDFRELTSSYPHLPDNITVIDIPSENIAYDIMDETSGPNMYNIAMALIKTSIPAILEDYGIVSMTIRYASVDPRQSFFSKDQRDYVVEVEKAEPLLVNEDPDIFAKRVDIAINAIIENVFFVVEKFAGDIEVMVESMIGYDTFVQLQLCEHTNILVNDCGLHHGDLNGLLTNSVSSINTFMQHRSAMSDVINVIKMDRRGEL